MKGTISKNRAGSILLQLVTHSEVLHLWSEKQYEGKEDGHNAILVRNLAGFHHSLSIHLLKITRQAAEILEQHLKNNEGFCRVTPVY